MPGQIPGKRQDWIFLSFSGKNIFCSRTKSCPGKPVAIKTFYVLTNDKRSGILLCTVNKSNVSLQNPEHYLMNNNFRKSGILLVLTAGFSWGVLGVFVRGLTGFGLSPSDISSLRALGAALLLAGVSLTLCREAFRMKLRDLWCVAGCGLLSVTLFNICYFYTISRTTVNIAVVLLYTSPAFVMLMSVLFFKEKLTFRKILSLFAVLTGCVLVSGVIFSNNAISCRVMLTGLGAGFFYALYTIFSRFAQIRSYSGMTITLWAFLFAGSAGVFMLDWQNTLQVVVSGGVKFWGLAAGLVLISTLLPYWSYTAGLKKLTPSLAAIFATVEPVVGTLIGIMLFNEKLTWTALAGMLIIIGAVFFAGTFGEN